MAEAAWQPALVGHCRTLAPRGHCLTEVVLCTQYCVHSAVSHRPSVPCRLHGCCPVLAVLCGDAKGQGQGAWQDLLHLLARSAPTGGDESMSLADKLRGEVRAFKGGHQSHHGTDRMVYSTP